ncbi:hypothetical protein MKW92_037461 [Papaver armeniacum]|nr:hypothetical protein MKW92_037461 [Papaver armeniacum]
MRHKYGSTLITPPPTESPSAESKMRMNIEKSDKMSLIFLTACFIGITSAFLIGYMLGIIGGVIFGTGYGNHFLPETYNRSVAVYGALIPFIPASLYFSGIIAILARKKHEFSRLDTRRHMILSGALMSMGSVFTALATTGLIPIMCVLGPTLYAYGFGLIHQGAQAYMSEMGFAHRDYLPSLNIAFKLTIAIGIFVANLVNCSTNSITDGWGWRLSIGIAAIPAAITSIGSFLLPDTPMSMIKLGKFDDAKQLLQRLHGTDDGVHALFKDLLGANEASKSAKGFEKQIMSQTHNRPYRLMAIAIPFFYAPYLFQAVGFQTSEALTYTAIIGGVNVAATIIHIISVRQGCRRFFLIAGGVQLFVGQIMLGILIRIKLGNSDAYDYLILATSCICVSGFAWSWGPLGWIFLSSDDDLLLLYPWRFVRAARIWLQSCIGCFPLSSLLYSPHSLPIQVLCFIRVRFLWEDVSKIWKQHWFWRRYFVNLNNDVEEDVSEVWKQHWFWRRYFVDRDNDLIV